MLSPKEPFRTWESNERLISFTNSETVLGSKKEEAEDMRVSGLEFNSSFTRCSSDLFLSRDLSSCLVSALFLLKESIFSAKDREKVLVYIPSVRCFAISPKER